MRVGELCELEADAVTLIGDAQWLRVSVGKLHTNRYIPLHPQLVDMLAEWSLHPHQLRHTVATQAVNRGMSLEAIAALLGHRSMYMTMTYARIAGRTVADE